jgi:hypothetical protein
MSAQLVSWLWCIVLVLSPNASILHLVRRILCDLRSSIAALQKIGHMLRPAASRRRRRPRAPRGRD